MDNVKEFKSRIGDIENETGYKYKVYYKGYKDALINNRLHVYWHKPCKLADITSGENKILFEVRNNFKADLFAPDGSLAITFEDAMEPQSELDTAVVNNGVVDGIDILNDSNLNSLLNGYNGWNLNIISKPCIVANINGKIVPLEETSIVKCIFDRKNIDNLFENVIEEEDFPSESEFIDAEENASAKENSEDLNIDKEKDVYVKESENTKTDNDESSIEAPVVDNEDANEENVDNAKDSTIGKNLDSNSSDINSASKKVGTKTKKKDKPVEPEEPVIKDSGKRTEFETGAVRDVQKGKGRCDLLPLDIVGRFFDVETSDMANPFDYVSMYQDTKEVDCLILAAKKFTEDHFDSPETAILEYACHMEDGCNKYGARNWEKGIPLYRYVDSGIRHLLKYQRGDTDERHDRAFIWNMLCGAWTCVHHPDLI